MSLFINFKTSGNIDVGDFLYADGRTKGKLRSFSRLKNKPNIKYIFGRAIYKISENLWAIEVENQD